MQQGHAIVVDIGKTQSKVSLWSREGVMLDKVLRPNQRPAAGEYEALDTLATSEWVLDVLGTYAGHPIEYIVPVAHGAAVAGIRDGKLAIVPPDYEWEQPAESFTVYRKGRDAFSDTGSPALPAGLNFGAQVHYLESLDPEVFAQTTLVPYAQYWGWLLTGELASEASSLGCHSDLWSPGESDFSPMAKARGWAERFAPLRMAGDVLGTISDRIAERTGLPASAKVLVGLHDSNAALLAARGFAEIEGNEATVLSTGTWFIAMRLAKAPVDVSTLPEARDCLVNVDAFRRPVPSARFMGGREIETLIEIDTRRVDIKPDQPSLLDAVPAVLENRAMVLPTLAPGNGPFPNSNGGWVNRPEDWFERRAGACLYAALVADAALSLIGSQGRLLVEGRFAEAEVFVRALASLRPDTKVFVANTHNDVSFGALRLSWPDLKPEGILRAIAPLDADLTAYRKDWHAAQNLSA